MRSKYENFDLSFAICDLIIMLIGCFYSINNLLINIPLFSLIVLFFMGFFYYWMKKNPNYLYFRYGSLFCTIFTLVPLFIWSLMRIYIRALGGVFELLLIFFNPILLFLILPYFIYAGSLFKSSGTSNIAKKVFIGKYGGIQAYGERRLNEFWHDNYSTQKQVEEVKIKTEKKNNYKIKLESIVLTLSFLSLYLIGIFI